MNKVHLIAASAALLLSSWAFMKTNSINDVLINNIEALTVTEEVCILWEAPGLGYDYAMHIEISTIYKRHKPLTEQELHYCVLCQGSWCTEQQFTKDTEWIY